MAGPKDAIARVLAVLALAASLIVLIAVISGSMGDGGGGGKGRAGAGSKQPERSRPAKPRKVRKTYIVRPGDSLSTIAENAGVPVNDLVLLNPDLDPQALISGQCVRLRRSGKCG